MGLSIKNEATVAKVRQLAKSRKLSITGAITLAVDNELAKNEPPKRDVEAMRAKIREIQREWAKSPPVDLKEIDDWMYGENGLPH